MGVDPVSFRTGRFNIGPKIFSLLEEIGVRVDSSIAPMRRYYGGPAHLSAPVDPYFPDPQDLSSPGSSPILEVPMTILPLIPRLGAVLERIGDTGLVPDSWISWFSMNLGSLPRAACVDRTEQAESCGAVASGQTRSCPFGIFSFIGIAAGRFTPAPGHGRGRALSEQAGQFFLLAEAGDNCRITNFVGAL